MDLPAGLEELRVTQCGLVSFDQARACGLSKGRIAWLLRRGHWRRVHRRVYATFTGPLSFEAQVWAAILRAGRGAVASHCTAAYLDGLCDEPGPLIHLTLPADRHVRSRIDGARIHYAHRLDRSRHPTLSPPRTRVEDTVLDLVDATTRPREVETWVTAACQRRRTTPERLADALGRRKKIRWRPMLESMLSDVAAGAQSPLELRHLRAVERAHGLPTARRQRRVAGGRVIWVDVDHDEFAIRIELDGRVGTPTKAGSGTGIVTIVPRWTAGRRFGTAMPTSSARRARWRQNRRVCSRLEAGRVRRDHAVGTAPRSLIINGWSHDGTSSR